MKYFETALFSHIHIDGLKMIHYLRYVDDIFALIDCKEFNTADELLHLMNYLGESIKFNLENGINMEMPFLDFHFKFTDSEFKTKIHRKSIHSNS